MCHVFLPSPQSELLDYTVFITGDKKICDTRPEFCEVFMLQSACIHKMQTQIEPPVNRQKPDILGNQAQTPFSHCS